MAGTKAAISKSAAAATNSRPLTNIVLASASPRRLQLLQSLGLNVEVVPSGYAEPEMAGLAPREVAIAHAAAKLDAVVAAAAYDAPVVAADTVVDLDGVAIGKPANADDAARMLRSLSGRQHRVHTAFALASHRHPRIEQAQTTDVTFHPLSDEEIERYVATGDPLDKAGAYGIQGGAAALVEKIDGDFYAVMGLPVGLLVRALRGLGFSLPSANATAP